MMKETYPIIIGPIESDGKRLVRIPDLDGYTEGTSLSDCLYMAEDYISLALIDREDKGQDMPIPKRLDLSTLKNGEIPALATIDTLAYRKRYGENPLKKN